MTACTTAPARIISLHQGMQTRHCMSTETLTNTSQTSSLIYNFCISVVSFSIVQQLRLADTVQALYSTQSPLPLSSPVSPTTSATAGRSWSVSRGTASCTLRMLTWQLPSTGPWVSVRPRNVRAVPWLHGLVMPEKWLSRTAVTKRIQSSLL